MGAITKKDWLLPTYLRTLLPGGQTSTVMGHTSYYKSWKRGVFAVFNNDQHWETLEDTSSAAVKEELAAIRSRIEADRERVRAEFWGNLNVAESEGVDIAEWFRVLARVTVSPEPSLIRSNKEADKSLQVGTELYNQILGHDGNPHDIQSAEALGKAYGALLLPYTAKVRTVIALMRPQF